MFVRNLTVFQRRGLPLALLRCVAVTLLVVLILRLIMNENTKNYLLRYTTNGSLPTPRDSGHVKSMEPNEWKDTNIKIPHLAVSACGNRLEEAMTLLKSAVIFTKTFLVIHVFSDSADGQRKLKAEFESWPSEVRARLMFNVLNTSYPADVSCANCRKLGWKSLFKPCASQRLFMATALPGVDSVLYVDADTLFLAPIEELWLVLSKFNSTQFVAAALDTEKEKSGHYYNRRIPYFGPTGINSGVLLMNLTRMTASTWLTAISNYLIQYGKTTFGDQDLINIYLHNHPENGYLLPCDWNFHRQQCTNCSQANRTGAALLHATARSFINDNMIAFKAVYLAFKQYTLGMHSIEHDLYRTLKRNLDEMKTKKSGLSNDCFKNQNAFTKRVEDLIRLS